MNYKLYREVMQAERDKEAKGKFCLCNHAQSMHAHLSFDCCECKCTAFEFDPLYEPPKEASHG